jgi:hypothetical protein
MNDPTYDHCKHCAWQHPAHTETHTTQCGCEPNQLRLELTL